LPPLVGAIIISNAHREQGLNVGAVIIEANFSSGEVAAGRPQAQCDGCAGCNRAARCAVERVAAVVA